MILCCTEAEADAENIRRTNAEIMERLQRAKGLKSPLSFLRPNRSHDDLLEEYSDSGSMTGTLIDKGQDVLFLATPPLGQCNVLCYAVSISVCLSV